MAHVIDMSAKQRGPPTLHPCPDRRLRGNCGLQEQEGLGLCSWSRGVLGMVRLTSHMAVGGGTGPIAVGSRTTPHPKHLFPGL